MKKNDYKRKTPQRRSTHKTTSRPWNWLLIGLLIGFTLPVFIYFKAAHKHAREKLFQKNDIEAVDISEEQDSPKKSRHIVNVAKKLHHKGNKDTKNNDYDFYNMLSNQEEPGTTKTEQSSNEKTSQYVLQTGAYKTFDEADQQKAELIVLGFDVFISKVMQNDTVLHRVNIGPFNSLNKAKLMQKELQQNNIESIVLPLK